VGLQRRGFTDEERAALRRAYRLLFQSKYNLRDALGSARAELSASDHVDTCWRSSSERARSDAVTAPLKLGVVGVGSLGLPPRRILSGMPRCPVQRHPRHGAAAAEVAAKLDVPPAPRLDSLLDDVDAVVIAVPTSAHEAVALAAIERGVHVLIEKPIAPTLDAADRIVAAADAAGVLVQIGHVERFNAALRACEPYLESRSSSSHTAWRRSARAAPTWPWCST
jgi:predicted dehydrogenase